MVMVFLIQFMNPYLSFNIALPDDYTDFYFANFYQFELENSFGKEKVAPGVFFDFIYKSEYAYDDPYFINSGLPFVIKAGGGGMQLRYFAFKDIELSFNIGYYAGNFSYPVSRDSGIIVRKEDWRKSLGTTIGVNLLQNFKKIRAGIKFYVNLIPFGAKRPPDYWIEPLYNYYYRSITYASLNSVGFGIVIGLNKRGNK